MQVCVIAVGQLKERYWREAQAEYVKRLSAYVQMAVQEVADVAVPESAASAQVEAAKRAEGERIRRLLRPRDGVVALDRRGRMFDSVAWSERFAQLAGGGYGRVVFLVGGSHGLDDDLLQRAHLHWSFGPLTLPHQLARVVLVEQLYRGIRIARGEPYHK
ncbi:MAG: 23S rRNA (pseudouridine(1915)-N(3))-methyltransferase RlmH [Alicyclobacillus sp.]|nr:23S rRNA (pseudouridine(1915)-N(3))-methyltransferase RlmH [Alicyclobacillus sp.]